MIFLDTPVLAISDGASPVLSFNYGAKRYESVTKAIRVVTLSALVYTVVPAMRIYFFAFIFQALQYSGQTVFKSLNKKKQAIFFSLLRKVVIVVPLTFVLPYLGNLGARGVFIAEPISNFLGGSACFLAMVCIIFPVLSKNKLQPEQ